MNTPRRSTPSATPAVRPPPSPSSAPTRGAYLVGPVQILTNGGAHPLALGSGAVVGRDPSCDVVVDDPLASRVHLHIVVSEDRVVLEDLKSRNGVFVNCVRVDGNIRLSVGDRVLLGTTELSIFSR